MKSYLLIFILAMFTFACNSSDNSPSSSEETGNPNPPAEGFIAEGSDDKAIALADEVMEAMGGRRSWDTTRYFHWNFFGARTLLWDKEAGRVRIESKSDSTVYLIDLQENSGKVKRGEVVLEHPDSLAKYTERGKGIWINDMYWLLMPFKLKDSGVQLNYQGQDTMQGGKTAEVLQLTFKEVGNTPQNKYLVYIDPATKLISQWDFYTNATDEKPRFSIPWANYKKHGALLLSGDRGQRQLSDIAVYQKVPEEAFTSFDPVNLSN